MSLCHDAAIMETRDDDGAGNDRSRENQRSKDSYVNMSGSVDVNDEKWNEKIVMRVD